MKSILFILSVIFCDGIFLGQTARNVSQGKGGIVYFSYDNGESWENNSNGLPKDIFLSDLAASDEFLGLATKQNGIFLYNVEKRSWVKTNGTPKTSNDFDALYLFKSRMFVGTQGEGVFISSDKGQNWFALNDGLSNLTVRKFTEIDNKLYVGTNGGLFSFDEHENKWHFEYGNNNLQVNGIIEYDNEIYIGTNQGAYKANINKSNMKKILPDKSLHNIGVARNIVYALVYNELFATKDKGMTWYSDQKGMPKGKYSFQIIQKDNTVLVGQWDGIYKKDATENWKLTSKGLPNNTPILEFKTYKGFIVAGSSLWTDNSK